MKDLIRILQRRLNTHGAGLVVDGILGQKTVEAIRVTGQGVLELLEPVISKVIMKVADIEARQVKASEHDGQWFNLKQLMPFINEASSAYEVPVSELVFFLNQEADKRVGPGGIEYNANSKSATGRHFGLMQLYSGAWKDAMMYDKRIDVNKLKSFDFKFVPRQSILASAAFIRQNRIFAQRYDGYEGPFTTEIDYAMYNQGHTFVKKAKSDTSKTLGEQSGAATNVLRIASAQVKKFMAPTQAFI